MIKHILFFVFGFLFTMSIWAQTEHVVFYEVIAQDSVKLFYNDRYTFVEKECADYMRYIRINAEGNFTGAFKDVDKTGNVMAQGTYINGVKHGRFFFYYPDGSVKSRGMYRNNKPAGHWSYYNEDGTPDCLWQFKEDQPLLISKYDDTGNLIVDKGNGTYNGKGFRDFMLDDNYKIKGEIVNGKREGTWVSTAMGLPYAEEDFENGEFVLGRFVVGDRIDAYSKGPDIHIFKPDYLMLLERFTSKACFKPKKESPSDDVEVTFNYNDLRTELQSALNGLVRKPPGMDAGDEVISIKFLVDDLGKPNGFELLSPNGRPYFRALRGVLRNITYPPRDPVLYFHMKLSFDTGGMYNMRYRVSRNVASGY